jgi:predicted NAD-dependent protein-ADP-ribosyltransferase YbiA (DUF1768 family)
MRLALDEKFKQNPRARKALFDTGKRKIIYASHRDWVMGTGLVMYDDNNADEAKWHGLNKLGSALVDIRDKLTKKLSLTLSE